MSALNAIPEAVRAPALFARTASSALDGRYQFAPRARQAEAAGWRPGSAIMIAVFRNPSLAEVAPMVLVGSVFHRMASGSSVGETYIRLEPLIPA